MQFFLKFYLSNINVFNAYLKYFKRLSKIYLLYLLGFKQNTSLTNLIYVNKADVIVLYRNDLYSEKKDTTKSDYAPLSCFPLKPMCHTVTI